MEYMKKMAVDWIESGRDINELMNMPFHFVIELLIERNKPKQEKSLIAAFGG